MEPIHHPIRGLAPAKLYPIVRHRVLASAPRGQIHRVEDEASGQAVVFHDGDRINAITVPIDTFQGGTLLQIRHFYSDSRVRLLDFNKRREGRVIQIRHAIVQISELPLNAGEGDIVKWDNGALVSTTLREQDVKAQRRQRRLENMTHREYRRLRV